MKALQIYAGPEAIAHIAEHGLQPQHIGVIPGAAGGPKGLILGPLDRFVFGDWLPRSEQAVHLVGASIGAWRMASACLNEPVAAFVRLERDYISQHYELKPGQKRPTAQFVSERFGQSLADFYGGRIGEVLHHPRYKLHVVTSRGRHILGREHAALTPLGYAGAFLSNAVHRRALGAWLERVVFSSGRAELPFDASDYRTRQVDLTNDNFMAALQASCSIPFALRAVQDIPGAPRGAYWDGGITDYHLHLNYLPNVEGKAAMNSVAAAAGNHWAAGLNGLQNAGLVLYPHFQQAVVPGWLDKALKWRHQSSPFLSRMVLLAPNPEWVKSLPNGKLPDRKDFLHYGNDLQGRMKAWQGAASSSQQLADEFAAWLDKPDAGRVRAL